jgi:hypothetical protein
MRHTFAALLLFGVGALVPALGAGQPSIAGIWEAAHPDNDDRLYIVLGDRGKVQIVAEYELPTPGKQRGRSTTFGTWARKGSEIVITYGDVTDRLRYVPRESLSAVGLSGTAPALKPIGKADAKSKLGSEVLWKAPHAYHVKAGEAPQPPFAPTTSSEPTQ